jgi:hypothetical protein
MSISRIRIIGVPDGEAPFEIRKQWVGLELPTAPGRSGVYQTRQIGLFDRAELPGSVIGYPVLASDALGALERKSVQAAAWWRNWVPSLLAPGSMLIFQEYSCEPINTLPPNQLMDPTLASGTPPAGQESRLP